MAITKIGKSLLMTAATLGAALGAARAAGLSKEEKDSLKDKYDLDEDASLVLRNASRGAAGVLGGGAVGGLAGLATGAGMLRTLFKNPSFYKKHPLLSVAGGAVTVLGAPVGAAIGAYKATNKYS